MKNFDKHTLMAVVGVSTDESKYGHKIFKDLLNAGYKVFAINPKGGEILGQKVYAALADLKNSPELVISVVPPEVTLKIVLQCHQLGIKNIWMQPGSESNEAIELAKKYHIQVVSSACFMLEQKVWPAYAKASAGRPA